MVLVTIDTTSKNATNVYITKETTIQSKSHKTGYINTPPPTNSSAKKGFTHHQNYKNQGIKLFPYYVRQC